MSGITLLPSLCVCTCPCLCVCLSLTSDSSETIKTHHHQTWHGNCLRHENASHVNYIELDFIQGHRSESLIISETVRAMPIKFAVKIVRLKVKIIFSQSDDLAHH